MSGPIRTVEEFIAWTKELQGRMVLFRGLANADWEVESSAYRRIRRSEEVSSETLPAITFQNYIYNLTDEASLQGFREQQGRTLSELELLAELQHFGAATCLIDFTDSATIALYFACREEIDTVGKVVAMETGDVQRFSTISYKDLNKPVKEFLNKGRLWMWVPSSLNNRIIAQQSVLVFGEGRIGKALYEEITIAAENKKDIAKTLEKSFGLNERKLFNDFAGFARINGHDQPYYRLSAEDYFVLSIALHQRGEHEQALESYSRAIELAPQRAEFFNSRGATKSILGDHQGAIADFDEAIELDPQLAEAFNNRGAVKKTSGDLLGAIEDYNRAIRLYPQDPAVFSNRGIANRERGLLQEALADFDRAIEFNPGASDAFLHRAAVKGDLGDYQGAVADCNRAMELNPSVERAYYIRGAAKHMQGDHQGAIADCNRAIELNSTCAEAFYYRGMARHRLNDKKNAFTDFNKAIKHDPNYAAAYNSRGVEKIYSGDHQGAIADFTKATELKPKFALAYWNRGKAKQAIGDEAGALEDFDRAKEFDPKLRPSDS